MNPDQPAEKSEPSKSTIKDSLKHHFSKYEHLFDKVEYDEVLNHLVKHKYLYLLCLTVLLLGIPFFSNLWQEQPLLKGPESYYHLSEASQLSWKNYYYFPLNLLSSVLPSDILALFPIILALLFVFLTLTVAHRLDLSEHFTFLFLALLISSAAFIFSFSTLSVYSWLLILLLSGILLLTIDNKFWNYFSLLPFILATSIDLFSSLFLLLTLLTYFHYRTEKEKKANQNLMITIMIITSCAALAHFLFFDTPLLLGPFQEERAIPDLLSDLGGTSGISLFALLLALGGLFHLWKEKRYYFTYLFLPLVIPAYILRTNFIFPITTIILLFSAFGFIKLFERRWNLETIKKFSTLVVILGLLFSTLTYLNRVTEISPTQPEVETLTWIKENIPNENKVFSSSQNSYYLTYFSEKQPLFPFHQPTPKTTDLTKAILTSSYTTDTFPLLEQNHLSVIYLSPQMKQEPAVQQGLALVLKNERFKMVHSSQQAEVWMYKQNWSE